MYNGLSHIHCIHPEGRIRFFISSQAVKIVFGNDMQRYSKFGNFREGFIFRENKPSRNGKITLSSTDIGKSHPSREL